MRDRLALPVDPDQFDAALRSRFWSYIDRNGADECWPWRGGLTDKSGKSPYGAFSIPTGGRPRQRLFRAARVVLALTHERVIYGWACHHCDNTVCCNPAHLYEGDARTNQADAVVRDRKPRGERHVHAVSDEMAKQIVALIERGASFAAIGRKYGLSHVGVRAVAERISGKSFARGKGRQPSMRL